jgi:copper chaperone NosL
VTSSLTRREVLVSLAAVAFATSCKRDEERCRTCGMKIDRASPWRSELLDGSGSAVAAFDTPRCAFLAWRGGKVSASGVRVSEYYDRTLRSGADVRFVVGGDVLGPMGPDLVPVDPARATKFIQDHGAERALRLDEVTVDALGSLR